MTERSYEEQMARELRTMLRRTFNRHLGFARTTRAAPDYVRLDRARDRWQYHTGQVPPAEWTVEDIVAQLVARAWPGVVL